MAHKVAIDSRREAALVAATKFVLASIYHISSGLNRLGSEMGT